MPFSNWIIGPYGIKGIHIKLLHANGLKMLSLKVVLVWFPLALLLEVGCMKAGLQECPSMASPAAVDFNKVMDTCNSSFSIPMEYLTQFNSTGVLPDETDKTGMCYIRCVFEKSGLINDWKLNKELLQQAMWPATGDSVEVCEREGKSESNACTRMYAIAKCLMIRAIVDARDKQVV